MNFHSFYMEIQVLEYASVSTSAERGRARADLSEDRVRRRGGRRLVRWRAERGPGRLGRSYFSLTREESAITIQLAGTAALKSWPYQFRLYQLWLLQCE